MSEDARLEPDGQVSAGLPGIVTSPGLVGCLYWRWLPRFRLSTQPSSSMSLMISRTFPPPLMPACTSRSDAWSASSGVARHATLLGLGPLAATFLILVPAVDGVAHGQIPGP